VTHRGPYKDGPGEINVPVSVGGMVVNPGDIVVGDQDGLLAIPQQDAAHVIEKALRYTVDTLPSPSKQQTVRRRLISTLGIRVEGCAELEHDV